MHGRSELLTSGYIRNDTFRLVSLDVHQTEHALYANVYMVDNASTATQLSELRGENVSGKWYLREHLHKEVRLQKHCTTTINGDANAIVVA